MGVEKVEAGDGRPTLCQGSRLVEQQYLELRCCLQCVCALPTPDGSALGKRLDEGTATDMEEDTDEITDNCASMSKRMRIRTRAPK